MKTSTVFVGILAILSLVAAGVQGVVQASGSSSYTTNFVIIYDGHTTHVAQTSAQTVGEAVRALRIDLGLGDEVVPNLMTEITASPFEIDIHRVDLSQDVAELLRTGRSPLDDRARIALSDWDPYDRPARPSIINTVIQAVGGSAPTHQHLNAERSGWLAAAGVPEEHWGYASFIIFRESSWNPNAINPRSGACGLAQAFPCSRKGDNWNDPVHSIRWQHEYVQNRYGGYPGAYRFWRQHGWY
ncbi:transglycosylase SLT domain-containing protein [Candidatus Saccharibacteria bacterium]|nr:transglycosylase SLT domain-containing protein [Candidatus Saccharibacteria bacterium]